MSVLFQNKGELIGLPPTGTVAYFTDATGALKQVDSSGNVTAVGGGGGLPSGTGLVKTTSGVGSVGTPYVDYLPGGDWFATEAKAMRAALPGLTSVDYVKPGVDPIGVALNTNIQDAGKEGGAIAGKALAWNRLTQTTIWQNMSTSVFAMSFQCQGNTQGIYFGAIDPTGTFGILIDTNASVSGHWGGTCIGTSGTVAPVDLGATDSAVHTFRVFSDATTVTFYLDGVSKGTVLTSATHFPTQQGMVGFNGPTSTNQALYRAAWGYVGV